MKILQLIPRLASGGAERFVVDLSNHLSNANEVFLYTLKGESRDNIFRQSVNEGVTVGYLNLQSWFDFRVLFRLYRCIKKLKPDVIHTHGRALHYAMILLVFYRGLKIVHTVHNRAALDQHMPIEHFFFRIFYTRRWILPVLISNEQGNNFATLYPKAGYVRINNGRSFPFKTKLFHTVSAEVNRLKCDDETKVFLNIARLSPQKNHRLLISAFKQLISSGANAILLIIGREISSHKESLDIKKFVSDECSQHIHWLGEKENATDYLYLSDYFCLSSFWEGMPISLIEAFATQCTPVCTPVGEIPLMIKDGINGFISKDVSERAYFSTLKKAYDCPSPTIKDMQTRLELDYQANYSMHACAQRYEDLYYKIQ